MLEIIFPLCFFKFHLVSLGLLRIPPFLSFGGKLSCFIYKNDATALPWAGRLLWIVSTVSHCHTYLPLTPYISDRFKPDAVYTFSSCDCLWNHDSGSHFLIFFFFLSCEQVARLHKQQLESRDYLVAWRGTKYLVGPAPLTSNPPRKRQHPGQLVPPRAGLELSLEGLGPWEESTPCSGK